MKVGVITFSNSKDNYGQILQCYAMQEFVKSLGHSPYLIRYNEVTKDPTGFKTANLSKYIKNFSQYINWYVNKVKNNRVQNRYNAESANHDRNFTGFINAHMETTDVMYDAKSIEENPPFANAFICGSDQIWGGSWPFYLSFAPEEAIKIAYAPSLGGLTSFTPEYEKEMKRLLSRLDFIGMREQSGVDTCIRLGFPKTQKVLDPTLLLDADSYISIAKLPQSTVPYVFCYLLGNPTTCRIDEVFDYAKRQNLQVQYVANQRLDKFPKTYPTIEEWIGFIVNAEKVITNSFHCVVFALIFHKPVIYLPLTNGYERMNCRIDELLNSANLNHLRYNGILSKVNISEIDFSDFDAWRQIEGHRCRNIMTHLLNGR